VQAFIEVGNVTSFKEKQFKNVLFIVVTKSILVGNVTYCNILQPLNAESKAVIPVTFGIETFCRTEQPLKALERVDILYPDGIITSLNEPHPINADEKAIEDPVGGIDGKVTFCNKEQELNTWLKVTTCDASFGNVTSNILLELINIALYVVILQFGGKLTILKSSQLANNEDPAIVAVVFGSNITFCNFLQPLKVPFIVTEVFGIIGILILLKLTQLKNVLL
jgi:hypothetical protein